jgi:hypothetical protein
MRDLFRSERELYGDIALDRSAKVKQVAIELIRAKAVVSAPLVNRVLAAYELMWPDVKEPFDDERTIAGIVEVIDARSRTFAAQAEDETQSVSSTLDSLVEAHR